MDVVSAILVGGVISLSLSEVLLLYSKRASSVDSGVNDFVRIICNSCP